MRINLALPTSLLEFLDRYALDRQQSRSLLIRSILESYFSEPFFLIQRQTPCPRRRINIYVPDQTLVELQAHCMLLGRPRTRIVAAILEYSLHRLGVAHAIEIQDRLRGMTAKWDVQKTLAQERAKVPYPCLSYDYCQTTALPPSRDYNEKR